MVEIFKTNVDSKKKAKDVISALLKKFPGYKINFDLEDCDRILRIEAKEIQINGIIKSVNDLGFETKGKICHLIKLLFATKLKNKGKKPSRRKFQYGLTPDMISNILSVVCNRRCENEQRNSFVSGNLFYQCNVTGYVRNCPPGIF